jgi:hypothetical protein
LFAQRALLQVDKATQETLGVADNFDHIRLQLINNRVDSEDRQHRIGGKIVQPLRLIASASLQQLHDEIESLESLLKDLPAAAPETKVKAADNHSHRAIEQTDLVLAQLEQVLSVLVKYETQNELLDIVRQLIENQQLILERTKKERQRKAFEGLMD